MKFPLLLALLLLPTLAYADDPNRIQPYSENPHYWQFKGEPLLLLGGSDEDNLFQHPELIQQLDTIQQCGGNYVRNTMSSRDKGNVWQFAKVEGKYDLDQWNPEYWERFETFLRETAKRDIIVQLEIWATFDYYLQYWDGNPFNPKNNRNYNKDQSRLRHRIKSHPLQLQNNFFRALPEEMDIPIVFKYQKKFIDKILEHTLKYNHVLYNMDNETAVSQGWAIFWANYIRDAAKAKGTNVETTDMRDPWNILDKKHNLMFDHPEVFTFIDISQNNHNSGEKHTKAPPVRRQQLAASPRPLNNVKVYGADSGKYGKTKDGIERFWRNIFMGLASTRFHRPDAGIGINGLAQQQIRSAREFTNRFAWYHCQPAQQLLKQREPNEAFCLAEGVTTFAVYFPGQGEVLLQAESLSGKYDQTWLNLTTGQWSPPQSASTTQNQLKLTTPDAGSWAVLVRKK